MEKYKHAIENSPDIIFWADKNGTIISPNKSFMKFFKEENLNIKDFDQSLKTEEDWKFFLEKTDSDSFSYETLYKNKENISLPVQYHTLKFIEKKLILIVARDITEKKKFEFKFRNLTKELIRSNNDLQEFAYVASHDLKEPLRKISMFANQAIDQNKDKNIKLFLEKITNASLRMQDMIESILEYSRIETRTREFDCYNLSEIINESLENCEFSLKKNNTQIFVKDSCQYDVFVDKLQIVQVFQNLISNSIKFRRQDIPLSIEIECCTILEGKRVSIIVKDNGIGIKNGFEEKIFSPFCKLHSKTKYKGHGMGLSFCKKIIKRHGGNIKAYSIEGQGSEMKFDLKIC